MTINFFDLFNQEVQEENVVKTSAEQAIKERKEDVKSEITIKEETSNKEVESKVDISKNDTAAEQKNNTEVKEEKASASSKKNEKAANKKEKGTAKNTKKSAVKMPANNCNGDSLDEINENTVIRHNAFGDILLTDFFTIEEIQGGIGEPGQEEGEVKIRKINGEDIRKKLEEIHPSFVEEITIMVYFEKHNAVFPIIQAGTKGACSNSEHTPRFSLRNLLPGGKIPFQTLADFISIAKKISDAYGREIHGDIYYDKEKNRFLLDFPGQIIHKYWVKPETNIYMQIDFLKVAEIHSHHTMPAEPSELDDSSERANIIYCIIGNINNVFPDVFVRTCYKNKHYVLDAADVFGTIDRPSCNYDLSCVSLAPKESESMHA
ncbi:hypothetical protein CN931_23990 [Bacillus sp. AFS054943]|uniref:JAB domain-containing protein n=1 Tax=Bacillus cereus TaxID=1396 RepID=A0A2C1LN39_BACCE|nr:MULTISPECIES: hypothetical protein [Bacillus]PGL78076.1 hypothetical protein CN931_23990 [Bacillus sp. AFS054943]PGT99862.1 hypothetical protein COD19_18190 [Bacillus cereus]